MSDRKYLRKDEVQALRDIWKAWVREDRLARSKFLWVFLAIFHTGSRVREILTLTDASFDEKSTQITIPRLKLRGRHKGSFKTVPVSETAMDEIISARTLAAASGQVTPTYSAFYAAFRHCAEKAGLDTKQLRHPHVLRHSYAMYLLKAGADVTQVRKLLGHATIQSTLVYLDESAEDIGEDLRAKGLLRP